METKTSKNLKKEINMETKTTPNKRTFDKIRDLTEQIDALYEEKNKLIATLVDRHGIGEWVTDSGNQDKPYLRLKIIDNVVALCEGKKVWKPAGIDRYSIELKQLKQLKNKPKEK